MLSAFLSGTQLSLSSDMMNEVESRVEEMCSGTVRLLEDGGFRYSGSEGEEFGISSLQIVEGWSSWEERVQNLGIFSEGRGAWEVNYSGDEIFFSGSNSEGEFIIDNRKNTDKNNIFVISEKNEIQFDVKNKYLFRFSTNCETDDEKTVKSTLSPYLLFYDDAGKEIFREKHYFNLPINGGWTDQSIFFSPPQFASKFSVGFFLNSFYKVSINFDKASISEFLAPSPSIVNGSRWVEKKGSPREFSWRGSNGNLISKTSLYESKCKSSARVSINIKFKKRTIIDRLFLSSNFSGQVSKLLHRNLDWSEPSKGNTVIDRWTPFFLYSSEGIGFSSKSGLSSVVVSNNGPISEVSLNILDSKDSPNFHFDQFGTAIFDYEQEFLKGDELRCSFTMSLGGGFGKPYFSSRAKGGADATFVMTHHADATINETFEAVMQGTSDKNSPNYGTRGLIGRGLRATWSVFSESVKETINDWEKVRCAEGSEISFPDSMGDIGGLVEVNAIHSKKDVHNLVRSVEYYLGDSGHNGDLAVGLKVEVMEGSSEGTRFSILVDYFDSQRNQVGREQVEFPVELGGNDIQSEFEVPRDAETTRVLLFLNREMSAHLIASRLEISRGGDPIAPSYIMEGKKKVEFMAEGLDSGRFRESMLGCGNNVEFVLHTATHYADDRQAVDAALKEIGGFGPRNWIDHSLSSGMPSSGLKSHGWMKESEFYIMDLFEREGYEYAWSYIDDDIEGINQLCPSEPGKNTPIIFQNQSLRTSEYVIWQWSTYRPPIKSLFDFVNKGSLDKLIEQRGISILHEYFSHQNRQEGYMFDLSDDGCEISDDLDSLFSLVRRQIDEGHLWNPTLVEFADHLRSIENVEVLLLEGILRIDNRGAKIEDYALWIDRSIGIGEITMDGYSTIIGAGDDAYSKFIFDLEPGISEFLTN